MLPRFTALPLPTDPGAAPALAAAARAGRWRRGCPALPEPCAWPSEGLLPFHVVMTCSKRYK